MFSGRQCLARPRSLVINNRVLSKNHDDGATIGPNGFGALITFDFLQFRFGSINCSSILKAWHQLHYHLNSRAQSVAEMKQFRLNGCGLNILQLGTVLGDHMVIMQMKSIGCIFDDDQYRGADGVLVNHPIHLAASLARKDCLQGLLKSCSKPFIEAGKVTLRRASNSWSVLLPVEFVRPEEAFYGTADDLAFESQSIDCLQVLLTHMVDLQKAGQVFSEDELKWMQNVAISVSELEGTKGPSLPHSCKVLREVDVATLCQTFFAVDWQPSPQCSMACFPLTELILAAGQGMLCQNALAIIATYCTQAQVWVVIRSLEEKLEEMEGRVVQPQVSCTCEFKSNAIELNETQIKAVLEVFKTYGRDRSLQRIAASCILKSLGGDTMKAHCLNDLPQFTLQFFPKPRLIPKDNTATANPTASSQVLI